MTKRESLLREGVLSPINSRYFKGQRLILQVKSLLLATFAIRNAGLFADFPVNFEPPHG